ncbi:MAG: hypothetical protein ROR55_02945 [Devosia sp.]
MKDWEARAATMARAGVRVAKWTGFAATAAAVAVVAAGIIVWDSDFYAARDRFEHFRLAMFGDWQPDPRAVTDALAGFDGIKTFSTAPVAGFKIVTGMEFASAQDVVADNPAERWCYITAPESVAVAKAIELGTQEGTLPGVFVDTMTIADDALQLLGVDADRLAALAREHCRFSKKPFPSDPTGDDHD